MWNNWFIQYPADNSEDLSKLVRLGPDNYSLITNFKIDTTTYNEYPYSVAYKLYEPLPDEVQKHDFVNIVKEMIPPVEEVCTLIPFVEEEITDIEQLNQLGDNQISSSSTNLDESLEESIIRQIQEQ